MAKRRADRNVAFVKSIMTESKYGPLMQAFVLEALRAYAEMVKENNPVKAHGLISREAWGGCALEIIEKIDRQHYAAS